MPGSLILCGTPIGNLGDVPPRLKEALENCDLVYAEDTRRTATLLSALGVRKPVESFFAGNESEKTGEVQARLESGMALTLVTDAGMPGISDPGMLAVRAARLAGATISVIPGPSAATSALVVSGFSSDRFVFEGFLPRKGRERSDRLRELSSETRTMVLFVSPHRIETDLSDLAEALGSERQICVTRELTKLYEEIWWGTLEEAREEWTDERNRGEFTVVLEGRSEIPDLTEVAVSAAREFVKGGMSPSQASRTAADEWRVERRKIYQRLIEERG